MTKRVLIAVEIAVIVLALVLPANVQAVDTSWTEGIRIRIENQPMQEVIDSTATNHIVDGNQTSDLHVVVSSHNVIVVNSPLIPLSGQAGDRVKLNQNLVSGSIDTVVSSLTPRQGERTNSKFMSTRWHPRPVTPTNIIPS